MIFYVKNFNRITNETLKLTNEEMNSKCEILVKSKIDLEIRIEQLTKENESLK